MRPQFLSWRVKKEEEKKLFRTHIKLSNTLFQIPDTVVEYGDQEEKQKTFT